jgi:stage II sporulation protein D
MAIASSPRPASGRYRSARLLTAVLLASSIVASAVVPALAVDADPVAVPAASASLSPEPVASTSPASEPTASPVPTSAPTAAPSASPSPGATPAPTASPEPTPTAPPAPTPTPTPAPTATPWPTPAWPTTVTTLASSVRFYGQGYGHGVGLSQHGARGRAQQGQTAEQIVAAYFKGTTLSTKSTTRAKRPVRVLVLAAFRATSSAPLVVYGRGGSWGLSGTNLAFPPNARLLAWKTTDAWKARVVSATGTTLHAATISGKPAIRPLETAAYLQVWSRPSSYDTYRGTVTLVLGSSTVNVVNTLGLDEYLRGVVPTEMPASWPAQALRAQVLAARSYAIRGLHPDTGSWDLYDDTRSQVYRGIEAEQPETDALIAAEPGVVIRSGDSTIKAFFFSTGGGATENNEYVFVGASGTPGTSRLAYLRGITDRNAAGVPFDASAPYYRWATSTLTRDQLAAMFAKDPRTNVGALTKLDLRRRGVSGRLYQVVLYGSAGTKTVSADVFRSVYNARKPSTAQPLRSNLFDSKPIP